jgi:diguanylate cyclase (GGDEF)-like protein
MKLFFVGDREAMVPFDNYRLVALRPTIRALCITTAVFNSLLIIPDLMNITGARAVAVTVMRGVYTLLVLAMLWHLKRFKRFSAYAAAATGLEAAAMAVFLAVFALYPAPDFSIQVLGMMVIIMLVYLTPNKWVLMNITAAGGIAGFLVCSLWLTHGIRTAQIVVGMIYLAVIAVLCAIFSLNVRAYQYHEYISREDLKRDYATDPLTGLGNRVSLAEETAKWLDRAEKYGLPLSLVVIDVDDMKKLNDTHGHVKGDMVLCQLAQVMRSQLRRDDICVRWGGDEFILLLPYTRAQEAEKLMRRMQRIISEYTFDPPVSLTCSFGIAPLQQGMNLSALMAQADEQMYDAKRRRRHAADGGAGLPV